jgi:UDP-N-acetylglucosamine 4,6-dehydratase/5-epimerase
MSIMDGKTILITGGTGSFGKKCTEILLKQHKPKAIRIFSRDELKQYEMQQQFGDHPLLRFFIGDIRDLARLQRAMHGVDIVIHAAALKQVPACEYNPFEAVKTNIIGSENIINAAIDQKVAKVMMVSTDKAVNPVNLYGATKMCAEKIVVAANAYSASENSRFSCVRYGNVVGSRGSVIPLFKKQRVTGQLTITDKRMTRFWLTLEQGVTFVLACIERMQGGEVFVPKIPSTRITDLANVVAPGIRQMEVGIRPGEKIHEVLLTEDEARHALEMDTYFIVLPEQAFWGSRAEMHPGSKLLSEGFRYASDTNTHWLTAEEIGAYANDQSLEETNGLLQKV